MDGKHLATGLHAELTEKQVTAAWQNLLNTGCKLQTENGQSLHVIYPGKRSDAPGSDFQDAVIKVNRQTLKGNIELHVKSSDWHKHEHDRNPIYNGVVLHVALHHDCNAEIRTQNGAMIPAVAIAKYLENDAAPTFNQVPCAGIGINSPAGLLTITDNAGLDRFYEKAARFRDYLQKQEAGQILYGGIMTALGFARNKEPFRKLSEKIPLQVLEALVRENKVQYDYCLALLLGTAGLLPSQRPEVEYSPVEDYIYLSRLERIWEGMQRIDVMAYADRQPFRVKPSNSPLRRIAGMNHLLHRYQSKGILKGLVELVSDAPADKAYSFLEAGLMAADDGYWSSRYDFGKGYPGLSEWLIGHSRAADITINILLPFVYAWGRDNGRQELTEKTLAIFRAYPAGETNTLEKHMKAQFGLKNSLVNSAHRQQGLLHLYKKWCTQGRCKECAVAGIEKS